MENKATSLRTWFKLNPSPNSDPPPSKRSGHSMVLREQRLYIFGGYDGNDCLNDLHSFDLSLRKWKEILTDQACPPPRTSHCAVLDNFSLRMYILFGSGKNFGNANFRDVWSFSFNKTRWEKERTSGQNPPGMYGHSGVFSHNFIYIFGGTTGTAYFSHLYRLCLVTKTWKRMALASQSTEPGARYKHACFLSPRSEYLPSPGLIILGGKSGDRRYVDAFEFSFSLNKWAQIALSDPQSDSKRLFNGRFAHTVCTDENDSENNEAWVFGGSDDRPRDSILIIDLQKSRWAKFGVSLPGVESSTPAARDFHSAALDSSSHTLYIFGGTFNDARLNDLWSIRVKGEEETSVRPRDTLLSDLRSLFSRCEYPHPFSDFTIRLSDGSSLHTYRSFLRMRLPHFFSSFGVHSSEIGQEVKMEERREIVKAILEFAYTG